MELDEGPDRRSQLLRGLYKEIQRIEPFSNTEPRQANPFAKLKPYEKHGRKDWYD